MRKAVTVGKGHQDLGVTQTQVSNVLHRRKWSRHDRHIHHPSAECLQGLERKAGARLDPDVREASFETPQEVAGERGDPQDVRTDPQKALLPAWRSASGLDRTGGSLEHDPGVLEKSLA